MGISSIDLQTAVARQADVSNKEAIDKKAEAERHDKDEQKEARLEKIYDTSVDQTSASGIVRKVRDDDADADRHRRNNKRKRLAESREGGGSEPETEYVTDPVIGKNIDISG